MNKVDPERWLHKARHMQWDHKKNGNRKGVPERLNSFLYPTAIKIINTGIG
ncbi:MAG: hypothetical protein JNM68_01465 [Dinghuibacter sp.]|nr:hypothetical protein [Dinghuibacter sp.]